MELDGGADGDGEAGGRGDCAGTSSLVLLPPPFFLSALMLPKPGISFSPSLSLFSGSVCEFFSDAFMQVAPFSAARPNGYLYYGYSSIVNVLDYSACTLPVTTADQDVDLADPSFKPVSETDRKVAQTCESSKLGFLGSRCGPRMMADGNIDDPEIYHGSHVSVQLVGRRLQEEKVLAVTEYVAGVLKA